MGLKQDMVEAIADGALGGHCHRSTPRQPTKAQYPPKPTEVRRSGATFSSWSTKTKRRPFGFAPAALHSG
jgi:hypothetical protein